MGKHGYFFLSTQPPGVLPIRPNMLLALLSFCCPCLLTLHLPWLGPLVLMRDARIHLQHAQIWGCGDDVSVIAGSEAALVTFMNYFWSTFIVAIFLSGVGNITLRWIKDTTTSNLFRDNLPKNRLYADGALTTMYQTTMIFVSYLFKKVVLKLAWPQTSTCSSKKPTSTLSKGLDWSS